MVRRSLLVATLLLLGAADASARPDPCQTPHTGDSHWASVGYADYETRLHGVEWMMVPLHGHGVEAWEMDSDLCGRTTIAQDGDVTYELPTRCLRAGTSVTFAARFSDGTVAHPCIIFGPRAPDRSETETFATPPRSLGRIGWLGLDAGLTALLAASILRRRRRRTLV
jgi:hypothetical protein